MSPEDLDLLRRGEPPRDPSLLNDMTLGRAAWLDGFFEYHIENFIDDGGSKVKVFVGNEGSGKTHLLRLVEARAREAGYETVFLSLKDAAWKLSDVAAFYKAVAACVDRERLLRGLCRAVADRYTFKEDRCAEPGDLLRHLVENDGVPRDMAVTQLRTSTMKAFGKADLSPSFRTLAYTIVAESMVQENALTVDMCWKWFLGQPLDAREKGTTRLYDRLSKAGARVWLYSLARLVRLGGRKGLVILLDDLDAMTTQNPETGRFLYTPNAAKDTFEFFRQIIDDQELLPHFLLLVAGRPLAVFDERRGMMSYEALRMRLQTGIRQTERFNPFADMVDVDAHLRECGGDGFGVQVSRRLVDILGARGYQRRLREINPPPTASSLRTRVMETALMAENGET